MADIQIATQTLSSATVTPTFVALNATDVYYIPNNTSKTVLYFKNTGSIATITFDITQLVDGLAIVDHTISVPATTGERVVGGFSRRFEAAAPQAGKLKISCNVASGVTVAAFTT